MEKIESYSKKFVALFKRRIEVIDSAKFSEASSLYKKILFVGVIDALSKTIYPRKGNRDRFVSFVRNFANWKDCERISLLHLVKLLEKVPDTDFSELRKSAFSLFAQWDEGETVYLNRDPDYSAIQKLWPKEKEYMKPLENIQLDSLKHVHLMYTYRNSLIHELRTSGYGLEDPDDDEPFYHSMLHTPENRNTWELVYPLKFFQAICDRALTNLYSYYSDNRINPYDHFAFGTYWIEELNK
jgi:hypothetical protein